MTLYQKGGNPINIAATNSKEVFDVTGAGDTVLAAVVAAYTSEFSMFDSVKIANMSAGIVVSKFGTAFVNSKELKTIFEKSLEKPFSKSVQNKRALNSAITNEIILKKTLSNMTEIGGLLDYAKRNKKKLVFTNGCFDVLHAGHIHLFKESRKFGNLLVVAINNDASVRILKGKSRPINCINNRIEVLKSIQFIDFIIAFSEETPERLIKIIKPHCLVKGGDYMDKNIVGSEFVKGYGGNVKIVPLVKDLSTTQILKQKA
jgi:D-beta-D-heptose 7-phosphate kinase/D-beta-D-heptose 1-phosphate adenosyltransferase